MVLWGLLPIEKEMLEFWVGNTKLCFIISSLNIPNCSTQYTYYIIETVVITFKELFNEPTKYCKKLQSILW